MLSLFIALLSFSSSLARVANVSNGTKCLFLNDEPCVAKPTLIDLNSVEFKYYPFMINLSTFTGRCNVLLQKYVFQKKQ